MDFVTKKCGRVLKLAMLVFVMAASLAHMAHAATPTPDLCDDTSKNGYNAQIQQIQGNVGYKELNAASQIRGMFGAIDVKAQYCWSQLKTLYESIGSLNSLKGFNPFKLIAAAIISQVGSQILSMVNSLCTAALSTVQSFKSFLLSQLNSMCIPLPDVGLGLGGIAGLSFANAPPCGPGSVPLFQFQYGQTPGMSPGYYNYRQFR